MIFEPERLDNQIKRSKNSYHTLVSTKNLGIIRFSHGVGVTGHVTLAKKTSIYPIYDVTHEKPKMINFFIFEKSLN